MKEIASTIPKRKPRPAKENQTPPPSTKLPKAQFADAPAIIALASPSSNDFNLGLACQNMVVAASALGYGTKIVMSGRDQLNTPKYLEILQIPEDMKIAVVLYVGKEDTNPVENADAITGASSRKPLQELSIIIE
ncbi:MAG: nitroreductase family protein [Bacteroidales bacterium]|nr:nitroreductase family protein [Bacteroidales bacterium]